MSSAPSSPGKRKAITTRLVELSSICQHLLQELCSNRLLIRVFAKVGSGGVVTKRWEGPKIGTSTKRSLPLSSSSSLLSS